MNRVKTLRRIIDHFEAHIVSPQGEGRSAPVPPTADQHLEVTTSSAAPRALMPPRFTLKAVEAPSVKSTRPLPSDRVVVLTDDGRGIAAALAERLRSQGIGVALVRYGKSGTSEDASIYGLEDSSAESITGVVEEIRRKQGAFGGLVHLLPLRDWGHFEQMDLSGWRERLQLDVRTLFYLLKLLENDLREAAGVGGGFVIAATGLGGVFASEPSSRPRRFFPGNGAILGFLKTVAIEWPEIRVKAVDLLLDETVSDLADHLMAEIRADDAIVEVGHRGSKRLYLGLEETRLSDRREKTLAIDSSWVILVTGGARGITAEVAHELARMYQPTLVIAGRSPAPSEEESEETSRLVDPKELKSALIKTMERQGNPFTVSDVQAAYTRVLKDREIRSNLAKMRRAGAKVEYCSVDVRREQEMASFLDRLYRSYGRLDGVIHGAGIIEDKLLKDKTWESFERVFGTKTESAFILSHMLRPSTVKFVVLFSSVAGRWGNVGQSDYTAANDVLNKLGIYLDDKWPGRVVSINWGPWAGSGMASQEVQRQFAERGIEVISSVEGPRFFDLEMSLGRKGETEVVVGQGPWKAVAFLEDLHRGKVSFPLLQDSSFVRKSGFLEIERRLDPERDLYLLDHCLDGKPVLPAAMAIELMAEAAQKSWPQWHAVAIREVKVLKGMVLENGFLPIRVIVESKDEPSSRNRELRLKVSLVDVSGPEKACYKGVVILGRDPLIPESRTLSTENHEIKKKSVSAKEAYRRFLFHGPRFQCIRELECISEQGIIATVVPSQPRACLTDVTSGSWLLDPVVLDSAPQLAIVWARIFFDITPLPSSFGAVHYYRPFQSASAIRCHFRVLEGSGNPTIRADVLFADLEGRLLAKIETLECTGTKVLNRLADKEKGKRVDRKA